MKPFDQLATDEVIQTTATNLKQNGMEVFIVKNGEAAKNKVYELIPSGSEVMVMTSETLRTLGIEKEIQESGKFDAIKVKISKMAENQAREKKMLGAAATYSIGSVHAITQDGKVLVASNTGSQLPGYAYGSDQVVWVVGAQKIVSDINEGLKRIEEYIVPLESVRARKAYGLPEDWNTFVSKLLVFNREVNQQRIKIVIVKEILGF